ncbi:MAG: sensor histidine kinase [Suipraeoptans sp.]
MSRPFEKIKQIYRNFKIQQKLTISHLIVLTIPMIVIAVFFYSKLYGMIVSDTIRNEQDASHEMTPKLESSIEDIVTVHNELIKEQFYKDIVNTRRSVSLEEIANNEATAFTNRIEELTSEGIATEVKLYLDIPQSENIFNLSESYPAIMHINQARGTYWNGIFRGDTTINSMFCPEFYLSPYEIGNYGNLAYITKFNIIYDGNYHSCYMAIYTSSKTFDEILKNNLSSGSSVAYLINDRDSIVAASDLAAAGTYHFNYDTVEDQFMSSNNFITKEVIGQEVYAGFYRLDTANWYLVVAMPSEPMLIRSREIMALFVFVYMLCALLAFWLSTMLSKYITRRLTLISNQMTKAKTSLPVPLPPARETDEIGNVIDSYNHMSTMIQALVEDQVRSAEELRIAEFNSLQSQINPHFLYNTMDMINWLANQGKTKEVTESIQKLSRFYKLTLSKKQSFSTIGEEIEHATIYLQLQNMRFDNSIEFVVDIPDELLEYSIPKLTFQPVIENSVMHGILEKNSKSGTIVLSGWLEDNTINIMVSDDGIGIEPDVLSNILDGDAKHVSGNGSNIAIYNTHRRIQVMYGAEYGLSYKSSPGEGTEVTIRFPVVHPEGL